MIRDLALVELREEIILAKLKTVAIEGGKSEQRYIRYSAAPRFAAWEQKSARLGFDGESADKETTTDRFIIVLPPVRADDLDGWLADTEWAIIWRDAVYRIARVQQDPVRLLAQFDTVFIRAAGADIVPILESEDGLLNE